MPKLLGASCLRAVISCADFAPQQEFRIALLSELGRDGCVQFVVVARDKPDPSLRLAARADHLDYIATRQDQVIYGGPLLAEGKMIGSLFIFEVSDRAGLDRFFNEDPYFARDIFASIEVFESRWLVPEKFPGALKAEAEQARRS